LETYLGLSAPAVIVYALEHWQTFACKAGLSAGVPWPAEPHIGFLLKHCAVAVNQMWQSSARLKRRPTPPAIVHWVRPAQPDPPHKLTDEEFNQFMAELKV
jgi:hypothetical protein